MPLLILLSFRSRVVAHGIPRSLINGKYGFPIIVPKKYDLADRKIADEVVSAAYTKVLKECPAPRGTRLQYGKMKIGEEGHYAGEDRTCFFTEKEIRCPDYLYSIPHTRRAEEQRASIIARQQAADEQRRRSELEAQARLDEKTQAFADEHGVNGGWVNWQQLRANPYSHDGKILLFNVRFEKMISPTSGLFNGMLVTELPANAFLEPKAVLLVAKVTGASEIKNRLGGTEQVPQATYVSHVFCEQENCMDYAGHLR